MRENFSVLSGRLTRRTATVAVVGLDDVGLPLLVAAGSQGFKLIGVDADEENIDSLRAGISYVSSVADGELADVSVGTLRSTLVDLRHADVIVVTTSVASFAAAAGGAAFDVADLARFIACGLQHGQLMVVDDERTPFDVGEFLRRLDVPVPASAGVALSCDTIERAGLVLLAKRVTGLTDDAAQLAAAFYAALRSGPGALAAAF
jgi:UDP-N-acetyl-D-mannosaminuronate dehydrogenase